MGDSSLQKDLTAPEELRNFRRAGLLIAAGLLEALPVWVILSD